MALSPPRRVIFYDSAATVAMRPENIEIPRCAEMDARLIFGGEYNVSLPRPPKTVLDFGGNVGLFSLWASEMWPDARITAYEPDRENARLFRKNTEGIGNITLHNAAATKAGGTAELYDCANEMCRSLHTKAGDAKLVDCVEVNRIPSAEFVKIDTEGSELEILENLDLSETMAVVMEAHSTPDYRKLQTVAHQRGFAVVERGVNSVGMFNVKVVRRDLLPKGRKLFIAVPFYGGAPTAFHECLMRLLAHPPCNCSLSHLTGDSLVSRARNTLTAEFLESDCTDLLFVDSDLLFSPDHVGRIAAHPEDVVGGLYPKKQEGELGWVINADPNHTTPNPVGLQQVKYVGTGFVRVARSVFERMAERWGDTISYHPDGSEYRTEHDYWSVGVYPRTKRYLSEDWWFCQRCLDLGIPVYADTRILLKHIGQAIYPLRSQYSQISNPLRE